MPYPVAQSLTLREARSLAPFTGGERVSVRGKRQLQTPNLRLINAIPADPRAPNMQAGVQHHEIRI